MQRSIAPAKYVRENSALEKIADLLPDNIHQVALAGGQTALKVAGERLETALKNGGRKVTGTFWYGGECCPANIEKLAAVVRDTGAQMLIGIGGGRALDTAKAAAFLAAVPLVTVPTIAATCAAFTGVSVVYDEQGVFLEVTDRVQVSGLVLVDLDTIARAPAAYLLAGVGDTLAKWYELAAAARKAPETAVTNSALQLSGVARKLLMQHSEAALGTVKRQEINSSLAEVVDAIIMIGGLVNGLGGDHFRSAGAHAVYSGLTGLPATHQRYHGEIVAFGILVQLMLENRRQEAGQLIEYYRRIGLPVSLADIGLPSVTQDELDTAVKGILATDDIHNLPFAVDGEVMQKALLAADALGRSSEG